MLTDSPISQLCVAAAGIGLLSPARVDLDGGRKSGAVRIHSDPSICAPTIHFLCLIRRALCFLTETERTTRFAAVVARRGLRRLGAVNLLLTFLDAAFLSFLATVLLFRTNSLPSRSAVWTKLVCDKASGTALALAAIVPSVLPIDSATVTRRPSSFIYLCRFDDIC